MHDPTHEELRHFLALSLAPKVGPGIFKAILAYAGSPQRFFQISKGKASKIPKVGDKLLEIQKQESQLLRLAEDLINQAEKKGFQILTYLNPNFPKRLKAQDDSPVVLFTKGKSITLSIKRYQLG